MCLGVTILEDRPKTVSGQEVKILDKSVERSFDNVREKTTFRKLNLNHIATSAARQPHVPINHRMYQSAKESDTSDHTVIDIVVI